MIRLRQTHGKDAGRVFEFSHDLIRIGRMPDSDIAFDPEGDLDASGRHAEIRGDEDEWVLIDAGSRNGTWLNGERVKHAPLKQADEIEFGRGGPRIIVEEISDRETDQSTTRLGASSGSSRKPGPVPPTEVPGPALASQADTEPPSSGSALGSYDVTNPMAQPVFAYPELDIAYTDDTDTSAETGPDTLRAQASQSSFHYWLMAAALVALAAISVVLLVKERRSAASLSEDVVEQVHRNARQSLLRIERTSSAGERRPLCLAFAVRERLLITTASCVVTIQTAQRDEAEVHVSNDGIADVKVTRLWRHPAQALGRQAIDVGLVEVDRPLPASLAMASNESITTLDQSVPLIAFTSVGQALVTVVEEVRPVDAERPDAGSLVVHSARVQPGSPLLDSDGRVVALHIGGRTAIRADLLQALIAGLGAPTD